jgi:hypothetical protein
VVDLLESVFEFGSPPFVELRERIWIATFREAARRGISLIFTFAPERTVRPRFPADAEAAVQSEGGRVFFVSLKCAEEQLERRLGEPSRAPFNKLKSRDRYRKLLDSGAFEFPGLRADLEIDTGALSPSLAAERIRSRLADGRE